MNERKNSEARIKANNRYNEKTYDRINIAIPKGRKAELQAIATTKGESLNKYVTTAIDERIARDNSTPSKADTIPVVQPPLLPATPIRSKLHAAMLEEHAKRTTQVPETDYESPEHLRNKFEWVLSDEEIKEATPEWEAWQGSNTARYVMALKVRGYLRKAGNNAMGDNK